MDIRKQFGEILRRERVAQGLTQEELAERSDVGIRYLSDLERGVHNPSLAVLIDLCRALKVHPSKLLEAMVVPLRGRPTQRKRSVIR
jgi:transcriptional regulator with XRE-family HTH domain